VLIGPISLGDERLTWSPLVRRVGDRPGVPVLVHICVYVRIDLLNREFYKKRFEDFI
jgi:hypothetical protein